MKMPRLRPPEWVLLHKLWGSMTGRVWLLLMVGIAAAVSLTLWLAWRDKHDSLRQAHQTAHIERLVPFAQALAGSTPEGRPAVMALGQRMGLWSVKTQALSALREDAELSRQLSDALGAPAKLYRGEEDACRQLGQWLDDDLAGNPSRRLPKVPHDCFAAQWTGSSGLTTTLLLVPPRGLIPPSLRGRRGDTPLPPPWMFNPLQSWLGLLAFALTLLLVAWGVTKLALRPLHTLSRAAQGFAQNIEQGAQAAELEEKGPHEIRHAMHTFNQMQRRIRANLAQRTQMMAAITHDLQTPLTRLRLRLEKIDDPALREKLLEDWQDAQDRIQEGLALARSLDDAEPTQNVDVSALVASVCDDAADAGQPVQYAIDALPNNIVRAQPLALKRCVENLLSNALRYGQASAAQPVEVSVALADKTLCITVRDHGVGIPASELEAVFEPFKRLESSRSRASGGSGLGLAIVRNLMTRQGGSVHLANHPQGGLVATLQLEM